MTADYNRMVRQNRINKFAVALMWACAIAGADEVYWAINYHFPLWDDIAMPVTATVMAAARFLDRYTRQYRF